MTEKVNLGRLIRAARERLGLNRTELAAKIGVTSQSIGRWEKGEDHPRGDKLVKLAKLLQLPLADLVGADAGADTVPPGKAPADLLAQFRDRIEEHVGRQVELLNEMHAAIRALTDRVAVLEETTQRPASDVARGRGGTSRGRSQPEAKGAAQHR